jgi:hypothetical protein
MQPNYNELAQRQQKDYQASRDPFQYGQQVAQRRYSEMMSNLDTQRQATQQSYGDLYSQAKQRAVGGAAVGGPTLSGGMGQQQRDYVSAIEMQELGRIGTAREGASRDLFLQGQAAFSNAQLEGQQATQMKLQDQQTQLQLTQQVQAISADTNLSKENKDEQLRALGIDPTTIKTDEGIGFLGWGAATAEGANFGDVARAVGLTALALGAVFVFGPLLAGMVKGGVGLAAGSGKLGLAGWKGVFGQTMRSKDAVSTIVNATGKRAPFAIPQIAKPIAQTATPTAINQTIDWFDRTPTPRTTGTGPNALNEFLPPLPW